MSKPLLVLDTNVVLDLFHFNDASAIPLRLALENGHIRSVVTRETLEELKRVLAYPEFGLEPSKQEAVLERYQSTSGLEEAAAAPVRMPRCTDPDDQKFLELAAVSRAQLLVTKDRALLKLRRLCAPQFRIMTPAEAVRWLDA